MVILLMKAIVRKALYWIVRMLHRIQGLDFIEKDTSVCSNTNNGYGFTDWMQIRQIVNFIKNQKRRSPNANNYHRSIRKRTKTRNSS